MTYYLKYRPQAIDELDLEGVRESLKKIVQSGKIPHAFLFSGPKGLGKTSAARILAKVVNCLAPEKKRPCQKCEQCVSITKGTNLDVIELDAASHRGIDDVRALRDAVKLAPASARKKIYIIDEAHMLTTEASNALLKTLEEPPSHVMFILATTNPEKLIETIRSRAVNIVFKKATPGEILRSLTKIVKGEKLKAQTDGLLAIAKAGDGSFRDATKILEQLISEGKALDKETVEEFLFKVKVFDVEAFIELLAKKDVKTCLNEIENASKKGFSMENLITVLLSRLRASLRAKLGIEEENDLKAFDKGEILELVDLFTHASQALRATPIEELPIEVAVVKWCCNKDGLSGDNHELNNGDKVNTKSDPKVDLAKENEKNIPTGFIKDITDDVWKKILASVRPINASIEALLRAAKPIGFDGKYLTLGVFYRFHKERLEEVRNKRILEDVAAQILGNSVRIFCKLTEPPKKEIVEAQKETTPTVLTEGKDKDIIEIAEKIFSN